MRLRLLVLAVLSGLICQGCAGDRNKRRRHRCEDQRAYRDHEASKVRFEEEADALRRRIQQARRRMGIRRSK